MAMAEDEVCGRKVEPGTIVMISPWLIHLHKLLWERPEAFIPDRFEGKAQDYLTNGAYIPFGAGPRICIGATFSLAEVSLVLAMLLERFEINLDDDRPITPVSIITTMPDIEPFRRRAGSALLGRESRSRRGRSGAGCSCPAAWPACRAGRTD